MKFDYEHKDTTSFDKVYVKMKSFKIYFFINKYINKLEVRTKSYIFALFFYV